MSGIELAWYASGIINNKLYIASELLKRICEIDLETKEVNTLCDIDCKAFFKDMHAIRECVTYKDSIYFMGMYGTGYFKYSIGNNICDVKIVDNSAYTAASVSEDEVNIIVPTVRPWEKIWRLDLSTGQYFEILTNSSAIKTIKNGNYVTHYTAMHGDKIYFPIIEMDYIVVLNLKNNEFESIKIDGCRFYGIARYCDNIIVSLYGSYDLIIYDTKTNSKRKIEVGKEKFTNEAISPYAKMYVYGSRLILLPSTMTDKIKILSLLDSSIDIIDYPEGFIFNKMDKYPYTFMEVNENNGKLFISQLSANMMLELNMQTLKLSGFRIIDKDSKERIAELACSGESIMESNEIDLNTFLENI